MSTLIGWGNFGQIGGGNLCHFSIFRQLILARIVPHTFPKPTYFDTLNSVPHGLNVTGRPRCVVPVWGTGVGFGHFLCLPCPVLLIPPAVIPTSAGHAEIVKYHFQFNPKARSHAQCRPDSANSYFNWGKRKSYSCPEIPLHGQTLARMELAWTSVVVQILGIGLSFFLVVQ